LRIATIDVGTNTVLLLVAERAEDGVLRPLAERATITRLGEGVDRSRRLLPAAIARTRTCLGDYAKIARELGAQRIAVVGTSALRDAAGGDDIRASVRQLFGVDLRVVSGDEEARLTFLGALSGLSRSAEAAVVFDIGGGSSEIVIGRVKDGSASISYARSFDVGSVRLTERHGEDRRELDAAAKSAFLDVPPLPAGVEPVGVAGTMTSLAAVALALSPYDAERVHGHVLRVDELRAVVNRLASMDVETRRAVAGMEPKRADVIVAGGTIALALLDRWACTSVRISDRGVRWGMAQELAGAP
jgi:exopolyphosphatase/guanosine-5'-triphosphate,3'-diphosphate pyrophosphatase